MNRIYGLSSHLPLFKEGDDPEDNERELTDVLNPLISRQTTFTIKNETSILKNQFVLSNRQTSTIPKSSLTGSLVCYSAHPFSSMFRQIYCYFGFNCRENSGHKR